MSVEIPEFDAWDIAKRTANELDDEDAPDQPKWSPHIAAIPGYTYEDAIKRHLAEHTGSPETFLTTEQEQLLATIIQDGISAQAEMAALEEALGQSETPAATLQAKYNSALQRIQDGRKAEHVLIECYLGLSPYYARESMDKGRKMRRVYPSKFSWVPTDMRVLKSPYAVYDDRVQVVNEEIVKAVRNFKPDIRNDKGELVRFNSFAATGIKAALNRYVRLHERPGIYLSSDRVSEIGKFKQGNINPPPERQEELLEWDRMREKVPIDEIVSVGTANEELDHIEDGPSIQPLAEVVADSPAYSLDELARKKRDEQINKVLNKLSKRRALVIRMRFGLTDGHAYTLEEISRMIGVKRERTRQIEQETLVLLRQPHRNRSLKDYWESDIEEVPPHTSPYPRLNTTRGVGAGAIRLSRDAPISGELTEEMLHEPHERWETYSDEEWDELRQSIEGVEH